MLLQMVRFHPFLWPSNIPLHIHHIFFIHYSTDGYLGCFHSSAVVNNTTVNIGVHVSFRISVLDLFGYIPRMGLLDQKVVLFLFLGGKLHIVFHSDCTNL